MSITESDAPEIPFDYSESGYAYEAEGHYEEEEEYVREFEIALRSEDFISGPYKSRECSLPTGILEFDFSFGYDCKKYYNLVVADPNTLLFVSGNLIHFFDVPSKTLTFRRSAFGGGLGHMTKNPNDRFNHIAVAENGDQPPIIIYDWPSLEIVCLLREGTAKCYNHLNYSPNGGLLVSQGGEPDHLITVWNWPRSRILLRTKSYVSDVYRVLFSPYCPGQLSTSGLSHIKFWKMARTFTGLKLQGELGRFGKTEYSDILGIYPMPDEKVISGCSWGNILIWEAGLIKLEVFRKLRKNCHDAPIVQFDFFEGELWTVGMDGSVKVWHYDTIDQADPPDEDRVVQLEPIFDFHTPNVEFMYIARRGLTPDDTMHYAQDGNGGIWLVDLNTKENTEPSEQLYVCHAGAVADMATCPYNTFIVSLGIDGRLHIYDYIAKKLLFVRQFPAKGVCMIWVPLLVDISGDVLFLGFDDGCLRVVILQLSTPPQCRTIQVTKPHKKSLTCMSLNENGEILVTGGEDKTIFVYKTVSDSINYVKLIPIGYVSTSEIVTCISFHRLEIFKVIVGCEKGYINIVTLPKEEQTYTTITYILYETVYEQRFTTYKAQIRRDIKLREIAAKKAKKRAKRMKQLEVLKKENPALEVDEETFFADSDSEEQLEPLFIPEIPNKILWIQHTEDDTLWLSMAGYDAGYIYECRIGQTDPIPYHFKMVYEADDIEISSFLYNYNKKYLIFAMQNGEIRVNKVQSDFRSLKNYWQISMHDNYNGKIPRMCFSYDEKYFFTCGHDGNIFSYKYYPEDDDYCDPSVAETRRQKSFNIQDAADENGYSNLSLEEAIVKTEEDRKSKLAADRKSEYLEEIQILKNEFQILLKRNEKLLPTQRIPRDKLELDSRITNHLKSILDANLALVRRKLAYELEKSEVRLKKLKDYFIKPLDFFPITVRAVRTNYKVSTLRQRRLPDDFAGTKKFVEMKLIEEERKGRQTERQRSVAPPPPPLKPKPKEIEFFLMGLSPHTIENQLTPKIMRLLKRYRLRKARLEQRQIEWDKFNATKPQEGVNHPDDEAAYELAVQTIGDFKLKTAPNYKIPKKLQENKMKKYKSLLEARERQYNLRHDFNERVHKLRSKKVQLRDYLRKKEMLLEEIHKEIPTDYCAAGPPVIELDESDFPESNLEVILTLPEELQTKTSAEDIIISEPEEDLLEKEVFPCLQQGEELPEGEQISAWESELKDIRIKKKIFQQNVTVTEMEQAIDKFDQAVENTYKDGLEVVVDATFLDLHILTLNQELMILKFFEFGENKLSDEIRSVQEEIYDIQDIVKQYNRTIEDHNREIEHSEEAIKLLQRRFQEATTDNKFYDFLRKIYKKKYKPPKEKTDDDESSESESSSSSSEEGDEEDAGSIDSKDVGPIRLDESVCPKGCDQHLFDLTYSLRTERHSIEQGIKDKQAAIEVNKKNIDQINKKLGVTSARLNSVQNELEEYQRLKQMQLNEIMCTVVLKLNQLQHLVGENKMVNVKDTLVFSKPLMARLFKRVEQLFRETEHQRQKHMKNKQHSGRMATDMDYMRKKLKELNEDIKELMCQKFGKPVNIDEINEASLKRMVFDLRMSMMDIKRMYEKEINLWRDKFALKQTELGRVIRENTNKLELLALLNTEKTELMKILSVQDEKRARYEHFNEIKVELKADILKLSEVLREQQRDLTELCCEIKKLKTKGLRLPPPRPVCVEEVAEEEEMPMMELDETDDIVLVPKFEFEKISVPRLSLAQIPIESRDAIQDLLNELFDALNLQLDGSALDTASDAIEHILNRVSMTEMIDQLLEFIPRQLEEEERDIVELICERIYALKSDEEFIETEETVTRAIIDDILNNVYNKFDAADDIAHMLKELIESIPLPYILEESSILRILDKIVDNVNSIDKEELVRKSISIAPEKRDEMEQILEIILDQVYGTGIDYLYYIDI